MEALTNAVDARALMRMHRDDAQRAFDAALAGGLSATEALAKARRPLIAARRARVQWLAELQGAPGAR